MPQRDGRPVQNNRIELDLVAALELWMFSLWTKLCHYFGATTGNAAVTGGI